MKFIEKMDVHQIITPFAAALGLAFFSILNNWDYNNDRLIFLLLNLFAFFIVFFHHRGFYSYFIENNLYSQCFTQVIIATFDKRVALYLQITDYRLMVISALEVKCVLFTWLFICYKYPIEIMMSLNKWLVMY
ncbi:hypothetical protein EAE91_14830 [Photorhabdus noenieputensis]|uniref:hypothetical protein n=1 Tax=Photorhabdus noenieputensis TaxID=1208607 RepID=UPI001BD6CCF0|nr:hypothetical protein [Photorhabdus noenieputensis]MBS9438375.1 hypothetical protein [Photorhabdus noenieputensis]MCK3671253.1 hypothetical protein [Photorhabdus noenieputensis]